MSQFSFSLPEGHPKRLLKIVAKTNVTEELKKMSLEIHAHELLLVNAEIDSDMDDIWQAIQHLGNFNGNDVIVWFKVEDMDVVSRAKVFFALTHDKMSLEDAIASIDKMDVVQEALATAGVKKFDTLYIANVPVEVRPYINYKNFINDLIKKDLAVEFVFSDEAFTWFKGTTN